MNETEPVFNPEDRRTILLANHESIVQADLNRISTNVDNLIGSLNDLTMENRELREESNTLRKELLSRESRIKDLTLQLKMIDREGVEDMEAMPARKKR